MELLLGLLIMGLMGCLMGWETHKQFSVCYKRRWQESLKIIEQEKINSKEIAEIKPPQKPKELPKAYLGKVSTPSYGKNYFKHVKGEDREKMEMHRLSQGLPPKDSMGGVTSEIWARVRMAQLEHGWEHHDDYFYKIK